MPYCTGYADLLDAAISDVHIAIDVTSKISKQVDYIPNIPALAMHYGFEYSKRQCTPADHVWAGSGTTQAWGKEAKGRFLGDQRWNDAVRASFCT